MSDLATIIVGDALTSLRELPDESVDCIVTSPPYWRLRDYGVDGQIGLEVTFEEFLAQLTAVFEECLRVLKPTGTCWVNMGDSYASAWPCSRRNVIGSSSLVNGKRDARPPRSPFGLPDKSLIGQPWRLAFALQDQGWILRRDIIWEKPTAMPESVRDRCTTAHEYIFHLVKSERYYFDQSAIAEPAKGKRSCAEPDLGGVGSKFRNSKNPGGRDPQSLDSRIKNAATERLGRGAGWRDDPANSRDTRNCRSVWTIPSSGFTGAHFATFPPELPRRCILAGCPEGGVVLDPFAGSGTTCAVALQLGRRSIGIELNPEYARIATERIANVTPSMFLERYA